jgi:hypothetical protein
MGMLVFLLANFLLVLPSRFLGSGALFGYLAPWLAFLGMALILPGMALAAVVGAGTDLTPVKRGTRRGRRVAPQMGV